jgi:predicted transcriptional regulator
VISLKQFRYFIEIVEAGSYSRAAEKLYIAQSALSRQIKELEDELQTPLLTRDARQFELTPAGCSSNAASASSRTSTIRWYRRAMSAWARRA